MPVSVADLDEALAHLVNARVIARDADNVARVERLTQQIDDLLEQRVNT